MTQHDGALLAQAAQAQPRLLVQPWRAAHVLDNLWDWDDLAQRVAAPNPFFERWALLPALENFACDHPVRLVTLYDGETLRQVSEAAERHVREKAAADARALAGIK